jgi:hypothetical protein
MQTKKPQKQTIHKMNINDYEQRHKRKKGTILVYPKDVNFHTFAKHSMQYSKNFDSNRENSKNLTFPL